MSSTVLSTLLTKGTAGREGADEPWVNITNNNGNASSTASLIMALAASATTDQWNANRRGFASFNTSLVTLPTGFIVTAATFTAFLNTKTSDTFGQGICLTNAVLANTSTIANSDYEGTKTSRTEYATRVDLGAMTAGTTVTWTMNAAGLAYLTTQIGSGNPTVLGLRWSSDVDQVAPTGWSSGVNDSLTFTSPQVNITYRIGPGHAVVSLTGTLANAGDTITCSLWEIEVFT